MVTGGLSHGNWPSREIIEVLCLTAVKPFRALDFCLDAGRSWLSWHATHRAPTEASGKLSPELARRVEVSDPLEVLDLLPSYDIQSGRGRRARFRDSMRSA